MLDLCFFLSKFNFILYQSLMLLFEDINWSNYLTSLEVVVVTGLYLSLHISHSLIKLFLLPISFIFSKLSTKLSMIKLLFLHFIKVFKHLALVPLGNKFGRHIKTTKYVKLIKILLLESFKTICSENSSLIITGLIKSGSRISLAYQRLILPIFKFSSNNLFTWFELSFAFSKEVFDSTFQVLISNLSFFSPLLPPKLFFFFHF